MRTLTTQTRMIPTNGIRLHVETAGPENGPLVILLHGFPDYWGGWVHQIHSLARSGFWVAAPDQRGYNLSDRPAAVEAYQIKELARDILGLMDYFNRPKAVLIGHDWGAAVAWYLASHHPERVERLAILNVPHQAAMNRALQKPLLKQLRKSWYILYFQIPRLPEWTLRFPGYAPLANALIQSARPGAFSREELRRYKESWSRQGLTGGMNWYRAMVRLGLKVGPKKGNREFERRITVPTLVLWGDQDAFLEPVLADWSMEWVDQGKLVHFPHATHWIQHEEPERVNHHLIDFLRSLLIRSE